MLLCLPLSLEESAELRVWAFRVKPTKTWGFQRSQRQEVRALGQSPLLFLQPRQGWGTVAPLLLCLLCGMSNCVSNWLPTGNTNEWECPWSSHLWLMKETATLTQISNTSLPSYWIIIIMQKWLSVGVKEAALLSQKFVVLSLLAMACPGPHLITICPSPTISQTGKLSPRVMKWCAQERTASWGRAEIQSQAASGWESVLSPVSVTGCVSHGVCQSQGALVSSFPGTARWTWSVRSPLLLLGLPFSICMCSDGGDFSVPRRHLQVSVCMCSIYRIHRRLLNHSSFWIPCLLKAKMRPGRLF